MKYHPDKEGGDAEKFLLIFEAYEQLTKEEEQSSSVGGDYAYYANQASQSEQEFKRGSKTFTKEEFEERIKQAKEKFQEKKYQEIIEENRFYEKLTSGWRMHYYYFMTAVSLLLSILFFADNFMPPKEEWAFINYKDIAGEVATPSRDVVYVEIDDQATFIDIREFYLVASKSRVLVDKTPILGDIKRIHVQDPYGEYKFAYPRFSVVSTFPLVCILLLFPLFVIYYRRKSPMYTFLFLTTSFVFPIIIAILLSVNDRLVTIFS